MADVLRVSTGSLKEVVDLTDRIQSLGWRCRRSTRQALLESIAAIVADVRAGKILP